MQFQVPQFIEVEDKIFGPLTFKQFLYVGGGLGGAYMFYRFLPFYAAVPVMMGIAGLGAALAFYQYNGRPFIAAVENGFYFLTRSKLYLWKKNRSRFEMAPPAAGDVEHADTYVPKLSESKLHDLAWSLDIQERIAAGVGSRTDRGASGMSAVHTAREALIK